MSKINANPVGIVKKDIYIIKNKINDKVYVGQAKDTNERFINHCKPSAKDCLVDLAIQKYGKENFYVEVLESQIENYNEKEKYWIKYYNCKVPNGYNISDGGENPPVYYGIQHPNAVIKDEQILNSIKEDLKTTQLSLNEIGLKHNVSKRTVMRINAGIHYTSLEEDYPLRKTPNINGKLTEDDIDEIIEILRFTYRQGADIGNQFGVGEHTIRNINTGVNHRRPDIDYPIRKYKNSGKPMFTYEQVTEILDLLANTNLSLREIAKQYNVTHNAIMGLNSGSSKRYLRDGVNYPIRKR